MNKNKKHSMIIVGKELDELKDTSFLCIESPDSAIDYLKDDLDSDILRNSLPRRILVSKPVSQERLWNSLPILSLDGNIQVKEEEYFILDIYDKWIEYLMKKRRGINNNLRLSIYFNDDRKAEQWKKFDVGAGWASELKFPCGRPQGKTIPPNLGDINVWRHISLGEVLGGRNEPPYYEFTSYHNPFFSFLYSISPEQTPFIAKYVIRQIVEAALLRILIVDDRIARTLWSKEDGFKRIRELSFMGIWVVNKITIGDELIPLVSQADENSKGLIDIKWKKEKNGNIGFEYFCEKKNIKIPSSFDILFMHQTIFDDKLSQHIKELLGNGEDWKEQWVFYTKKSIPYFIFHSGRGKQKEKLPKNVPFLEYSVLQQCVLQEPSKFFLSLLGMSAKEV